MNSLAQHVRIICAATVASIIGAAPLTAQAYFVQENLVSDLPGVAAHTDPNQQNPWGLSSSPTGPFWISDNGTGKSTVYGSDGSIQPLVVTIPPPAGGKPPSAPTGQVFNPTSQFNLGTGGKATFIFATEDGTLAGWNSAQGTTAQRVVDNSAAGAIYKGLALGTIGNQSYLYASNFSAGSIDVFNKDFKQVQLSGKFSDPNIPKGYAPFNVQNIGNRLYVTYALQDADKEDDVAGKGHGFIDVFNLNGHLEKRLASDGTLNSPWGLALAPGSFGAFAHALLVGNFGDGMIQAFDPTTGNLKGFLTDQNGKPIAIEGLWGLKFGNGEKGGATDKLYFTAGIPGGGNIEDHGLFGDLRTVPEPATLMLLPIAIISALGFRAGKYRLPQNKA